MMLGTKECGILGGIVFRIPIDVGELSILDPGVLLKAETESASAPAFNQHFSLDIRREISTRHFARSIAHEANAARS